MKQHEIDKLTALGDMIKAELPGHGFALLTYYENGQGLSNFVSTAQRPDMIKYLLEVVELLKSDEVTMHENKLKKDE